MLHTKFVSSSSIIPYFCIACVVSLNDKLLEPIGFAEIKSVAPAAVLLISLCNLSLLLGRENVQVGLLCNY